MPTYVYKFIDTGETIEIYQAFSDDALTEASHPSDGKPRPVKKVFTPVGVTFKGGGTKTTVLRVRNRAVIQLVHQLIHQLAPQAVKQKVVQVIQVQKNLQAKPKPRARRKPKQRAKRKPKQKLAQPKANS